MLWQCFGTFNCSSPGDGDETDGLRFIPSSVLSGVSHLHDHGIVHWDLKHVAPPPDHSPFRSSARSFDLTCGLKQTGEHSFPHQGPVNRYRYRRLWHVHHLSFLAGNTSHTCHMPFSAKTLDSTGEPLTSGSLGYVAPEVLNQKVHDKPVDLWLIGWGY